MALPPTCLSLFSGGGGLDLGLHSLGFRTVCYVEREAYAASCLVARMEEAALDSAPIWSDVGTFDGRPWRGVVDCVTGGSPCQDLSVAGKRAGLDGERSGLFWEFVRIVREVQPALVSWENVGGATSALPRVCEAFEAEGYAGAVVKVRASDVGAPHQRARVFLLAYRDGDGLALLRGLGLLDGERAAQRDDADGCGEGLGHASGCGVEGGRSGRVGIASASAEETLPRCAGHEFPPTRGDAEGWADYLARGGPAPAQPRICRGVDGVASWVESAWADRLRLLGNGVVPQQAAAAFRFLARRLR